MAGKREEEGARFLKDSRIQDARIPERLAFLREKGFSNAEVDESYRIFLQRTSSSENALASLESPKACCVPPGCCVLGEDKWTQVKLLKKTSCGASTRVLTFSLPDVNKPLGLSTCACILARAIVGTKKEEVIRPYTPISTNIMKGKFELMIKIYPNGKMGQHMDAMVNGDTLAFKHIPFNVKIQYPFGKRFVGMICGGTGITPMLQALHALLDPEALRDDKVEKISMLYGSQLSSDILADDVLSSWEEQSKGRFKCTRVLSEEPPYAPVYVFPQASSLWKGERGLIDRRLVQAHMPPPESDCIILVCGPPPMYNALCGARDDESISGVLADLGYSKNQVYKF